MNKNSIQLIALFTVLAIGFTSCQTKEKKSAPTTTTLKKQEVRKTKLAFNKTLPEKYNSPDGMTVGKDGNIYLSMCNAGNQEYLGSIMRITKDNQLEEFASLPPHPVTGKVVPLGVVFGPDGNLYVSDNQSFATDTPNTSRLIRVVIENDKPVRCEVVAKGFNMANGISTNGKYLFVAETNLGIEDQIHHSGVYRFDPAQLSESNPYIVSGADDPNLILRLKTLSSEHKVGANGVAVNSKGELFVCNFGDAQIIKAKLNAKGNVVSHSVFAQGQGMVSCDGLQIDKEDNLWVADFVGNAIAKINGVNKKVEIIAKNNPGTGENGDLDAPSECIRRGDCVYVSNIDIDYGANTHDDIHTMSRIDLKE